MFHVKHFGKVQTGAAGPRYMRWPDGHGPAFQTPKKLLCRIGFYGMVGQGLAQRPNRAGNAMAVGDHVIKSLLDPVAIGFCDDEGRKQFYGVACVACDLAEDFVIFKQWYGDELAEEAGVHCFKECPSCLEF
jgi:hypothetical protein